MNLTQIRQFLLNNLWYKEQGGWKRGSEDAGEHIATQLLVMPDTARPWGMDGSHWNPPPLDLSRMKNNYAMQFAIFKGCDGSLNTNYYFDHVAAAKQAGIPWGMYVWLYPNSKVSITAQVNAWKARFDADPPPLGLFIDVEWTYWAGSPANPNATDARSALDKWKALTGLTATIYTAAGYANSYMQGFVWDKEPLWIANYGVTTPLLPKGATKWTWWQFTSTLDGKQLDPNGNAELDGSYWNGGRAEFEAIYGGGTPPPPSGGSMYECVDDVAIRDGSSYTYSNKIGVLYVGDKVEAVVVDTPTDPVPKWLKFTSIQRADGTTKTFTSPVYCSANVAYVKEIIVSTPPDLPAYFIGYSADGTELARYNKV